MDYITAPFKLGYNLLYGNNDSAENTISNESQNVVKSGSENNEEHGKRMAQNANVKSLSSGNEDIRSVSLRFISDIFLLILY